jgi:hypothetical protein
MKYQPPPSIRRSQFTAGKDAKKNGAKARRDVELVVLSGTKVFRTYFDPKKEIEVAAWGWSVNKNKEHTSPPPGSTRTTRPAQAQPLCWQSSAELSWQRGAGRSQLSRRRGQCSGMAEGTRAADSCWKQPALPTGTRTHFCLMPRRLLLLKNNYM